LGRLKGIKKNRFEGQASKSTGFAGVLGPLVIDENAITRSTKDAKTNKEGGLAKNLSENLRESEKENMSKKGEKNIAPRRLDNFPLNKAEMNKAEMNKAEMNKVEMRLPEQGKPTPKRMSSGLKTSRLAQAFRESGSPQRRMTPRGEKRGIPSPRASSPSTSRPNQPKRRKEHHPSMAIPPPPPSNPGPKHDAGATARRTPRNPVGRCPAPGRSVTRLGSRARSVSRQRSPPLYEASEGLSSKRSTKEEEVGGTSEREMPSLQVIRLVGLEWETKGDVGELRPVAIDSPPEYVIDLRRPQHESLTLTQHPTPYTQPNASLNDLILISNPIDPCMSFTVIS